MVVRALPKLNVSVEWATNSLDIALHSLNIGAAIRPGSQGSTLHKYVWRFLIGYSLLIELHDWFLVEAGLRGGHWLKDRSFMLRLDNRRRRRQILARNHKHLVVSIARDVLCC